MIECLHALPEDTLNAFIGMVTAMSFCLALVWYRILKDIDNKDEEEKI